MLLQTSGLMTTSAESLHHAVMVEGDPFHAMSGLWSLQLKAAALLGKGMLAGASERE